MPIPHFFSWSWRRRVALLSAVLLPCLLALALREINSWRPQRLLSTGGIADIEFSPTEPLLAYTVWKGMLGEVQMWDTQHRTLKWSQADARADQKLAFSPNGELLASAATNVVLWDAHTGRRLKTLKCELDPQTVYDAMLQFSPDGRILTVENAQGLLLCWNVAAGKPTPSPNLPSIYAASTPQILSSPPFTGRFREVTTVRVAPDGKMRFIQMSLWENRKGQLVGRSVSSGSGRQTAPLGHEFWLGDSTGHLKTRLHGVDTFMGFSPEGRWLLTQLHQGPTLQLQLWNTQTGKLARFLSDGHKNKTGFVSSALFSRDSTRLYTAISTPIQSPAGNSQQTVSVWDTSSGKLLRSFVPEEKESLYDMQLALSEDDSTLAITRVRRGFSHSDVQLWRVK